MNLYTVHVWLILQKPLHPEKVPQNSSPGSSDTCSSRSITVRVFTNRTGTELACEPVNQKIFEGITNKDFNQIRKVESFQLQQNGPGRCIC